uniref:Reverse transcriptase zinc-binding domain-containing protein n=1 Tax=Oryza barthii TaxID=65489 RepID=A0A0D3F3G9_9ORYZ
MESIDHILSQCPESCQVWWRIFNCLNLQLCFPSSRPDFDQWWMEARCKRIDNVSTFDTLVILIARGIWKECNNRADECESRSWIALIVDVAEEVHQWMLAKTKVVPMFCPCPDAPGLHRGAQPLAGLTPSPWCGWGRVPAATAAASSNRTDQSPVSSTIFS